jgi:Tfp pilus assembly protein PilF
VITNEDIEKVKKGEMKFSELLNLDSKKIAALLLMGHTYYAQGQLEEAKKVFEGLAVLDGKNAYVHGILGSIYQQEEKFDLAIARYTMALSNFPQDINSLANRGEVFLRLGKFKEAADDLKKAIELDPEKKHPSANRARMLIAITQEALKLVQEKGVQALVDEKKKVDSRLNATA